MLVKGRDKTFPERITTKKQRSPMVELSGILRGRGYIAVSFVSTQESCAEVVVLCGGHQIDGINRLNNAHI